MRVSLTGGLDRLKGDPEGVPNVNMRINARRPFVTIALPSGGACCGAQRCASTRTQAWRDGMTPIDEIAHGFDVFVLVGRERPTESWCGENGPITG